MHCVWLCSHRLLRGGGRVGAHTLYAYWGFVHTLAVSWDIPPSGIVIGVTSLLARIIHQLEKSIKARTFDVRGPPAQPHHKRIMNLNQAHKAVPSTVQTGLLVAIRHHTS